MTTTHPTTDVFARRESEVRSYARAWPTVFATASGATQTAEDGTAYLDLFAGAGALNYGHNQPALVEAAIEHLRSGAVVHSLDTETPAKRAFLETFERRILEPRGLRHKAIFPGPTGTNAVEVALKTARLATGRPTVLSFSNGFHGMTLGSLAVTGNARKRAAAGVELPWTTRAPYDDDAGLAWLEQAWSDPGSGVDLPAAAIVETVQGEGGLRAARPEWLRALADLCRRHGVVLIVDEVQTGCGRTGAFFGFEESGIDPDVIVLSKSLSGLGMPMALTLVQPELDVWEPGGHNGTFRGFTPAFVTATAALETFWADDELAREVAASASVLEEALAPITQREGVELRGRGLMRGIRFDDAAVAGKVAAATFARHVLVETSGPHDEVVKLLPPLTITHDELRRGAAAIADAVDEVLGR